jgi:hypothetical protein
MKLLTTTTTNCKKIFPNKNNILSSSYYGTIRNQKQARLIRDEMTDPARVWFPSWQASEPHKMRLRQIRDDRTVTRRKVTKWQEMVRKKIKVGHTVLLIEWDRRGTKFETTCVVDKSTIVYDSILSNTVTVDSHSRCFDYRIGWIWQTTFASMTRGKIWADCLPTCSPNGTLINCGFNCGGSMALGTALCTGTVAPIPGTNCCNLAYSWGWGTPLITVTIVAGAVTITGSLGSSGSGAGTCTCCCPATPTAGTGTGTAGGATSRPRPAAAAMCNVSCMCQGPDCPGPGQHCPSQATEDYSCAGAGGKCVRRADHSGPHKCGHGHYFSPFRF